MIDWKGIGYRLQGAAYQEVSTWAELPDASLVAGEIYVVLESTGVWLINRKQAGMWYSSGASWTRLGDTISFFNDDNFQIYDGSDSSKVIKIEASSVTPGQTRTITMADADVDLADIQWLKNNKEVPLTFSNGLTRSSNEVKNDLITGKASGQTIYGGTAASENLTIHSTLHATKGIINLNSETKVNDGSFWVVNTSFIPNPYFKFYIPDAEQCTLVSSLKFTFNSGVNQFGYGNKNLANYTHEFFGSAGFNFGISLWNNEIQTEYFKVFADSTYTLMENKNNNALHIKGNKIAYGSHSGSIFDGNAHEFFGAISCDNNLYVGSIYGGETIGHDLNLYSTSHEEKGEINLNDNTVVTGQLTTSFKNVVPQQDMTYAYSINGAGTYTILSATEVPAFGSYSATNSIVYNLYAYKEIGGVRIYNPLSDEETLVILNNDSGVDIYIDNIAYGYALGFILTRSINGGSLEEVDIGNVDNYFDDGATDWATSTTDFNQHSVSQNTYLNYVYPDSLDYFALYAPSNYMACNLNVDYIQGTLPIVKGGTNANAFTSNKLFYYNGTSFANTAYNYNAVAVSATAPITLTSQTIALSYNATNLKITSNALNTIQDIATTSNVTFNTITLGAGIRHLGIAAGITFFDWDFLPRGSAINADRTWRNQRETDTGTGNCYSSFNLGMNTSLSAVVINHKQSLLSVGGPSVAEAGGLVGNLFVEQLPATTITSVTPVGATGSTVYSYKVVAVRGTARSLPSAAVSTTTGNATLDANNYNSVKISRNGSIMTYDIYRSTDNVNFYFLATLVAAGNTGNGTTYLNFDTTTYLYFYDQGQYTPTSQTPPTTNESGKVILYGKYTSVGDYNRITFRDVTREYCCISGELIAANHVAQKFCVYNSGTSTIQNHIKLLNTGFVYNDDSNDLDYRIESNDNANMFVVDAGLNRIGIGTAAPNKMLTLYHATDDGLEIKCANKKATLYFNQTDETTNVRNWAIRTNNTADGYFEILRGTTGSGATTTPALTIKSDGKTLIANNFNDTSFDSMLTVKTTTGNKVFAMESTEVADVDPNAHYFIQERVQTTNATLTTLWTMSTEASTSFLIKAHIVANVTEGGFSSNDGAGYYLIASFISDVDTVLAQTGTTTVLASFETDSNYTATLECNSSTIFLKVQGVAARTIIWHGTIEVQKVSL